jgi:hypothetical protein
MMGRYATLNNCLQMPVLVHLGMLEREFPYQFPACGLTRVLIVAWRDQRGLGCGLIATPPGGQEDDRGQQVVPAKHGEQLGGRDFR